MKRKKEAAAVTAVAALIATAVVAHPSQAASINYPSGYETWKCGNTTNRMILTFDDRPGDHGSPYTYQDTIYWGAWLKSKGIRAMFFFNDNPVSTVNTLRQQGHYVANHTSSRHLHMPTLTNAQLAAEVKASVPGNMVRPPHGDYNAANKAYLASLGYRVCTWGISTKDWEGGAGPRNLLSTDQIRAKVRANQNVSGGVILGHMWTNYPQALPGIIDDMHAAGKLFCRNTGPTTATIPFPLECT